MELSLSIKTKIRLLCGIFVAFFLLIVSILLWNLSSVVKVFRSSITVSGKVIRNAQLLQQVIIDAETGQLTLVGHEPCGGSWPWNLAIDPTSRFLLAANFQSGNVVVFSIDEATGQLSPTGHEVAVPHPVNVAML